ncbi:hypothetical protein HAX54_012905 [Datura stramonium]|uniref:Uncharacterized protein n=1 Tax=Datura stramonium TaxID=4076 RepID=A0ABS8RY30_DATST|nr:hypothetical protein [Datura stramonium]
MEVKPRIIAAKKPLCLNTTLAAYVATSDVIFLPSFTTPLRRFPANASRMSTVIHVITVARTARTTISNVPTRKAAPMTRNGTIEERMMIIVAEKDIKRIKTNPCLVVIVTFIFNLMKRF